MNILRLSALSLTIVLFTLGGLILPESTTLAHHCKGGHWKPACDDPAPPGSDGGDTEFMVEMQRGTWLGPEPEGLVTSDGVACGSTEGQGQGELDVAFPASILDGCVTVDVSFITPPTGTVTLTAFALLVKANNSAVIFFTDGNVDGNTNTGGTYVSDRLPATINRSNDGSITVTVNESGQFVEKNHQPDKGDLVGPIAIGEIVYTPITP